MEKSGFNEIPVFFEKLGKGTHEVLRLESSKLAPDGLDAFAVYAQV